MIQFYQVCIHRICAQDIAFFERERIMETRQDKLIKLATEMANKGELKITPECAEYQIMLTSWM